MVELLIFIETRNETDEFAMRDTLAEWEEVKEAKVVNGETENLARSDIFLRVQTAYSAWGFVDKLKNLPGVRSVDFAIVVPKLPA